MEARIALTFIDKRLSQLKWLILEIWQNRLKPLWISQCKCGRYSKRISLGVNCVETVLLAMVMVAGTNSSAVRKRMLVYWFLDRIFFGEKKKKLRTVLEGYFWMNSWVRLQAKTEMLNYVSFRQMWSYVSFQKKTLYFNVRCHFASSKDFLLNTCRCCGITKNIICLALTKNFPMLYLILRSQPLRST